MQDDIREARLRQGSGGQPIQVAKKNPETPIPVIPLPPKGGETQAKKVVMKPSHSRGRHSKLIPALLVLLLIIVVGSGGLIWWFLGALRPATPLVVAPLAEILPATSSIVIQYAPTDAEARGNLLSVWNRVKTEEPTIASLVAGDPRLLLLEADVTNFSYVLIENDTRPYLLVPHTPRTEELLAKTANARVAELKGWYILNAVATEPYRAAVDNGLLSSVLPAATSTTPFIVWVGPATLNALRDSALGSALAMGRMQEAHFSAIPAATNGTIALTGTGKTLEPLPSSGAYKNGEQLLAAIPGNATFIYLGTHFAKEAAQWGPLVEGIDMTALTRSSVDGLLQQLTGPYALYTVSHDSTTRDVGLIITLSAPPVGAAIEEALEALLPLVTGRPGVAHIEFSDNTHAGLPLRYANFSQPSQALDYAVVGTTLVITTSRESMFTLLETLAGTEPAASTAALWQPLLSAWGALPRKGSVVMSQSALPAPLASLLPIGQSEKSFLGLTVQPVEGKNEVELSGLFLSKEPL
jgi:hypothetical protein